VRGEIPYIPQLLCSLHTLNSMTEVTPRTKLSSNTFGLAVNEMLASASTGGEDGQSTASTSDEDGQSAAPQKKTLNKTGSTQTTQVFFMIGCQRSGSNWLRTMLSEREDLIAPHPPHIMRDFMPRLEKYGDLTEQRNLKVLIDHVCAFVERNQVQWLDLHSRPMKFNHAAILMEVIITIECFHFKEKLIAKEEGREVVFNEKVDNPYYLVAIFDAIMGAMTKANGKKIWMCKSMGMSQFHDLLLSFYGKERLRYIYLVRDPRDVCLSFMKTPVGDCHPYAIAKKWAKLQNFAFRIMHETPDLIHHIFYEEVLSNKERQVAKVIKFMGARSVCRSMRRGSVVAIKSNNDVVSGAKKGREAVLACHLSYQFKNLGRGDSFTKGQFKKWAKEMSDKDLVVVESVALKEMQLLGYEPGLILTKDDCIDFTEELQEKCSAANKTLIEKMNADLAISNPKDLQRRKIQAAVLEKTTMEHFNGEFVKKFSIDVDGALESIDSIQNDKGFQRLLNSEFDFQNWPANASKAGFQPDKEVQERFEVQEKQKLKLKGGLTITFAAASQGGYYPSERDKANQDAYIAGAPVSDAKRTLFLKKKKSGILFAVFDGHGPSGAECARHARAYVEENFVNVMKHDRLKKGLDQSIHVSSILETSYHDASSYLEKGGGGVNGSHSGTTATSLFVTKDFLHTANVGDSRCLLIEPNLHGKPSVVALTVDHTPDREDEIKRIEAHGGIVMSSDQYDNNDLTYNGLDPNFQQKRIWSKSGKWPGTAFTRSIGDAVAKKLGVSADPECANFSMPTSNAMFVLGSDGVFDFVPDEEVGGIVQKYADDPEKACRELVGKAWNRWCDNEERSDDITVIVGHVKHLSRGILGNVQRQFTRRVGL